LPFGSLRFDRRSRLLLGAPKMVIATRQPLLACAEAFGGAGAITPTLHPRVHDTVVGQTA
jgi:hypothetical protein